MPRSTTETGSRPAASGQPNTERMARIAAQLATQAMPLARMALGRVRSSRASRLAAAEAEVADVPQTGFARAAAGVARMVNAVGTTLYDYSNGQYGLKPVDMKELRQVRKAAEKEAAERQRAQARGGRRQRDRAHGQTDQTNQAPARRGNAKWILMGVGALAAGAAVAAVVILQREQLRAATTQALDRGRQTVDQTRRQLQARSPATRP